MTSLPRLLLIALAALFIVAPASAADASLGSVAGSARPSIPTLDIYSRPDAASPARKLEVDLAGFPLPIEKKENGYAYVNGAQAKGWLRLSQVRVTRPTAAAGCLVAGNAPQRIGATPGVADPCKPAVKR